MEDTIQDAFYPEKQAEEAEKKETSEESSGAEEVGAGEQEDDPNKVSSEEGQEEGDEEKPEEGPEEEESPEEDEGEDKEAKEGGLDDYFKKNPSEGRSLKKSEFALKEGDYEEKDGKIVIRSAHFEKDVKDFFNLQGSDATRHIKRLSKGNPQKLELMAKYMGFVDSDGEVDTNGFISVSKKYFSKNTSDEEAIKIEQEVFPKWLTDETQPTPFIFEEEKKEEPVSKDIPFTLDGIEGGVKSAVDIYNAKVEEHNQITQKDVMNNPKMLEFIKSNKFDPATGELRKVSEVVSLAFDDNYSVKRSKKKSEGGKRGAAKSGKVAAKKSKFVRATAKTVEDEFFPKN